MNTTDDVDDFLQMSVGSLVNSLKKQFNITPEEINKRGAEIIPAGTDPRTMAVSVVSGVIFMAFNLAGVDDEKSK